MPAGTWEHFESFRREIIGIDATITTHRGEAPLTYFDWTASGRAYRPLEAQVLEMLPFYANTHSENSHVGRFTSQKYHEALQKIRKHVNAAPGDEVLFKGAGATAGINWLQYMLGLRYHDDIPHENRPVVFVTHMEHHSNQTSWEECAAEVVILERDQFGRPDPNHLERMCRTLRDTGRVLYGSFTACSNVTGVMTNYYELASILHQHGGSCFIDFAASAPYVAIDMHPSNPLEALDAIFFSPHKFLGGPGSAGVVVFNSALYKHRIPVQVGGGIVKWTDPWGGHSYVDGIGVREDAGTPAIIQGIRAGLAVEVKEQLDPELIQKRKAELLSRALDGLAFIPGITVLAAEQRVRQGIISFTVDDIHYALVDTLLSDFFGMQARDGCSCAGTYGHQLFEIDRVTSGLITQAIDAGDNSAKPGWVRVSLHPTTTDAELEKFLEALAEIVRDRKIFERYYCYQPANNSWQLKPELKLQPPSNW